MIKINLGSGTDYKEGYINVDQDVTYNITSKKKLTADVITDISKKLPFKDNYADEIYCGNVFEHIPNPLDFLLEIKRVLKKGGKAIIITSNASYFIYHFPREKGHHDFYNKRHSILDQHYFLFQKGHLEAFTKKTNMKLVKLDYHIADLREGKNRSFQSLISKLIGKKYGYSDFYWEVAK